MGTISARRLGAAFGITVALLYVGCAVLIALLGREGSVLFFNSLLHGIDVGPIVRSGMPWWEAAIGVVEVFAIGWLVGATVASVYNFGAGRSPRGRRSGAEKARDAGNTEQR